MSNNEPLVILILGLPGAGKTTLGKKIAEELHLPFISKDDIKVRLFDVYGWKDREASKQAGMASFRIMDYFTEEQIKHGNSLILESTFNPAYDDARFQAWQKEYGVRYAQLYCYADADVVRERFAERAKTDTRHVSAVEGDEGLQVLENYIEQGFNPLNIESEIIKVDTTDFSKVDEAGIIKQIALLLEH
ncbi:MAG TPA: ATP-binding protein [Candidatus Saccharimonadales bacterium]|nr:ATP-binding protein [Candidatus Saccharimonadales bacterium]